MNAPFHYLACDYSHSDLDDPRDHLKDVPWEDFFKRGASAASSEFCEWFQVGINACNPHRKNR